MENQKLTVLTHIKKTKDGITSWEAITNYRITRLAARISELKGDGHTIEAITETQNGKHYARYFLIKEAL